MRSAKKSYRIKSKLRFTTSITITILLFVFMVNNVLGINDASSLTKNQMIQIQIESGDTLWNLAAEYGPAHTDPRKTVYEICSLNGISADSIYPGQIISIPYYSE
ncbi:LysM peptidoglycan-binding domain-containing protein [Clostridium aminobutyricum]|uniref:LysM peptidoglycan-binding domain-containing protein n=1 Tax=Clostridium aminobutyricum TaxID=33953 RepID=A0A939IHY5_CLOAM|nr:LysM peptidoglycan-binding domain-containing protein [Clostridium aminobutyricum]MBN7772511.1 LysM peptidoglycan-binding domain-containing protein [Clostridium aminobutyricum]